MQLSSLHVDYTRGIASEFGEHRSPPRRPSAITHNIASRSAKTETMTFAEALKAWGV